MRNFTFLPAGGRLRAGRPGPNWTKATALGLLLGTLQLHPASFAQAAVVVQTITLDEQAIPLSQALQRIEQQSGYSFLYNTQMVRAAQPVTLHLRNASLSEALTQCFAGQALTYTIEEKLIIVKQRPASPGAVAAPIQVTGKVTDEKGEPLPGVTVLVKGTTAGTSTGSDGAFSLTLPSGSSSATLRISFVGYVAQEVVVSADQTVLAIRLRSEAQQLSEAVVVGYGTQSRSVVSTAISSIDGKNLAVQPVGTATETLAAQAPGVVVQSDRGGTPGATPNVVIRGGGSLATTTTPLYVVDGYPLQDASQFSMISPSDIASIDVLKDAASAAIYGSRAANGVVIVTTKRGKAGKTTFNFTAYTGLQQITKKLDVLDRDGYIAFVKLTARSRAYPTAPPPTIFDSPALNLGALASTNWQNEIYRVAPISEFQLSASGGTERVRFALSGNYFRQEGVLKGSDYQRYTMRFNLDADLVPKLRVGVSVAPTLTQQSRQPAAGSFNNANSSEQWGTRGVPNPPVLALMMPPTIPVFMPNGDYGQGYNAPERLASGAQYYQSNIFNPAAIVNQNQNNSNYYRLFGNSYLEWEPLSGLVLKTTGGATLSIDQQTAYIPATLATEAAPQANLSTPILAGIYAREGQGLSVDYLWENTATYTRALGNHNFSALALYSVQKYQSRSTGTSGRNGTYASTLLTNPLASPDRVGEIGYDQNAFQSYAARITYDYKRKYIATAALRADGSSRFGQNNRFGTFPSASLAWRLSEESFWQALKPVVSELKLRASYGQTGNANIGSFNYLNSVVGRNYSFNGGRAFGYVQSGFANPDLTWEKNTQTDLGFDLGLLDDKFVVTLDYYNRLTEGMLLSRDLPAIVGYATNYRTNIGQLRNRGLELAATANLKVGELRWTINGNIAGNRSKVLDLGGPAQFPYEPAIYGWNNVYQVRVGDPLGNMYGFKVLGVFQNADELAKYPNNVMGERVGNFIIQDTNGDGKINEDDRTLLGKGMPDFTYGLTQNLQYKGFDLTLIMQGVQGTNVINGNLRYLAGGAPSSTTREVAENQFDPANPTNSRYNMIGASGYSMSSQFTDRALFSGSYLRVRNLTLGYTFQGEAMRRIKFQSVRLYVTGQNLLTFTSYPGYNPEVSINAGTFNGTNSGLIRPGLDQSAYPATRTYIAGLNFSF